MRPGHGPNTIVPRDLIGSMKSIFNGTALHYRGRCAGGFGWGYKEGEMTPYRGSSDGDIRWKLEDYLEESLSDDSEVRHLGWVDASPPVHPHVRSTDGDAILASPPL